MPSVWPHSAPLCSREPFRRAFSEDSGREKRCFLLSSGGRRFLQENILLVCRKRFKDGVHAGALEMSRPGQALLGRGG